MKRLSIAYGDQTLCETDDVAQFSFTESEDGVSVTAKFNRKRAAKPAGNPNGLMDLLAAAGKSKSKVIEESI